MRRMGKRFSADEWAQFALRVGKEGRGRTLGEFREWLGKEGVRIGEHFGSRKWTLWEAYEWMCEGEKPKMGRPTNEAVALRRLDMETGEILEEVPVESKVGVSELERGSAVERGSAIERVNERVREYLAFYKDASPNDISTLRDLAFVEVNIESVNRLMTAEIECGTPDPVAVKNFSDSLARMSQQSRALQEILHIDRATRERDAQQSSEADNALLVMEAAGEHVAEFGIELVHVGCTKSGTIGASQIMMGFLLWDFKEVRFELRYVCPRCGKEEVLTHEPTQKQVEETARPEWVDAEEGVSAE